MYLPPLDGIDTHKDVVTEFGGYNHNLRISAAEFYDMENMTSAYSPALSPRPPRANIQTLGAPYGICARDGLIWVDGTAVKRYYEDDEQYVLSHHMEAPGSVTAGQKQIVAMGSHFILFPDKIRFDNRYELDDNPAAHMPEALENAVVTSGTVRVLLTDAAGDPGGTTVQAAAAPEDPAAGDLWIDTGKTPHALKRFDGKGWNAVTDTYVKFEWTTTASGSGSGAGFSQYDGVTVSGCDNPALNGSFLVQTAKSNYVTVSAPLEAAFQQTAALTIERRVPEMDFVVECGNRLWGCSSEKHEIYASKLGDPKNWNCFMGLSTDSYAATIGSEGPFTGAATHLGAVYFFKEEIIHKVYGTKPANFQVSELRAPGVEEGSHKSLVLINERLYYKSRDGFSVYDGSLPVGISRALGKVRYRNAVAGAVDGRYYVSVQAPDGAHHLFVYDTERGLWHREDGTNALGFARYRGSLFYIDAETRRMCAVDKARFDETFAGRLLFGVEQLPVDNPAWSVETGELAETTDKKYISKLQLRLCPQQAQVRVSLSYDGGLTFTECYHGQFGERPVQSVLIPILPRRSDSVRLRVSGTGVCRILAISKYVMLGSEV